MKKLLVGLIAAAAMVAACSNDTTTPPPVVASVTVVPAADSAKVVGVNETMPAPLVGREMFWSSSDTTVAIVSNADSLGVVTGHTARIKGVAAGTATITATISGVSGVAAVKVKP